MMYDTDYAIYQYINAQVEQYVEFDDLLKQNHCTMEEAQQEICLLYTSPSPRDCS